MSAVSRSRPGRTGCCMRFDGPPRLPGIDRGFQSAPGSSAHTRTVSRALSVAQPVMSFTTKPQIPRLRTAAERERDDVVDLQSIAGAATLAAVRVDIAATPQVAPPHLPPHGSGDVPGPGARPRAEAAQRREVPLQCRRTLHRPHRTKPGRVRNPLRRRSRQQASVPHRHPRRVASTGLDPRSVRAICTVQDTAGARAIAAAPHDRPQGVTSFGLGRPLRRRSGEPAAVRYRYGCRADAFDLRMPLRRRSRPPSAVPGARHRRGIGFDFGLALRQRSSVPAAGRCRRGCRAAVLACRGVLRRRSGEPATVRYGRGCCAAAFGFRMPLRRRSGPPAGVPYHRPRRATEYDIGLALRRRSGEPGAVRYRRGCRADAFDLRVPRRRRSRRPSVVPGDRQSRRIGYDIGLALRQGSGEPAAGWCRRGCHAAVLAARGALRRRSGAADYLAHRRGLRAAVLGLRMPLRRRRTGHAVPPRRERCVIPPRLQLPAPASERAHAGRVGRVNSGSTSATICCTSRVLLRRRPLDQLLPRGGVQHWPRLPPGRTRHRGSGPPVPVPLVALPFCGPPTRSPAP